MPAESRLYDIVVFGATGFTGSLTARYLAAHVPAHLSWAVAGRSRQRLEELASELTAAVPLDRPVDVLVADVGDAASMRVLAASTRLVASTVGPFMEYGDALVAACADAGTDYVDITGEPEFVDRMWFAHHARALETGARLVHSCGFDSIPHDLGAWWTLRHLPTGAPITMRGYVRAGGTLSAGTYHSAVRALGRVRQSHAIASERRSAAPRDPFRRVGAVAAYPHREPVSGRWAVPLPTIDPVVVRRSARAMSEYGPDFRYGHFAVVGGLHTVAVVLAGVTGVLVLSQFPPTRGALLRVKKAGDGPPAERRAKSWFSVQFVATSGDQTVVTEVRGGDPGYDETAKMLAESALCLALDALPETAGQVTTAQAMGDALVVRLQRAGIGFSRVEGTIGALDD